MTNVCLDLSSIPYHRGVSRYTRNLFNALQPETALSLSAYGSSLRNFVDLKTAVDQLDLDPNQIQLDRLPPSILPTAWKLRQLLPYRKFKKPLVFHAWEWHLPPADNGVGWVTTIHDLAMLRFPEIAHPQILKHHRQVWQDLQHRSAQIVAVSQTTKLDLIELLGFSPQQITVVPEALPAEIRIAEANLTETRHHLIKQELQLNQPFMLFVGTTEPRKNLTNIIQAWLPFAGDYQLIVAGSEGWDQITDRHENLRFLGPVNDQQLSVLYGEANLLIFASLYEGFGLPILEAFHHGTPVVTSDNSGMKEVAGNAAVLVDPLSSDSIQDGIKKILNEDIEAQQTRLKKMVIRGQMFSWSETAKKMVRVYQQAEDEIN